MATRERPSLYIEERKAIEEALSLDEDGMRAKFYELYEDIHRFSALVHGQYEIIQGLIPVAEGVVSLMEDMPDDGWDRVQVWIEREHYEAMKEAVQTARQ